MPFLVVQNKPDADSPFVGDRADRLVQQLVQQSRSFVTGLFDHDCVSINGQMEPDAGRRLEVGDDVSVRYEANRRYTPKPRPRTNRGFSIVFEDDSLIVVEKSPELLTVPTDRQETNTLVDRLGLYLKHSAGHHRACVVHRLDRGVSGLLVFGKADHIAKRLQEQFSLHKPDRLYCALVAGQVAQESGKFQSYLATGKTLTRFSTNNPDSGEYAETHYRVEQQLAGATLVEVRLETGRRNQIRVHFSEAGHPILGDDRYAPEQAEHRHWPHKRIALHARTLGFEHPVTRKLLKFESPLPTEFQQFVNITKKRDQSRGGNRASAKPPKRR